MVKRIVLWCYEKMLWFVVLSNEGFPQTALAIINTCLAKLALSPQAYEFISLPVLGQALSEVMSQQEIVLFFQNQTFRAELSLVFS